MSWSFGKKEKIPWPKDESNESIPPVFLTHIYGGPLDTELTLNVLEAYGIPYICEYPHNGLIGKLILGQSASGIKVFVPETLLEDAQNVLNADIIGEDDDDDDCFDNDENDDNDEDGEMD